MKAEEASIQEASDAVLRPFSSSSWASTDLHESQVEAEWGREVTGTGMAQRDTRAAPVTALKTCSYTCW